MDLQQPPVFLDRSSRGTRGKRMTKLLDDELEEDEVFWNQDALKEEEHDVEYEEEAEVADVYDSDFDDDEPEADEEVENEPDERTRTKKKLIFPGKPPTKKKKNKALSRIEKVPEDEVPEDEKISGQSTPGEHHEVPDDAEEEKIVRKSSRTSVIIRQAERDAVRAALQATTKPIKKKKEGEEKRMSQEEMLLEAAQTEIMNLRNLERVLAREEEVKKRAIVHKQVYSGPKIQYLSKDGSSYLNFTGGSSFQSEISTTPIPYPEKAICVITGLPAMGFLTPEENVSSQNSQIPPNHQYSPFVSSIPYPSQFPNFPLVANFQGFGNFFKHPINVPRAAYQITSPNYWQNMNNPYFSSSYFYGLSNPQATGTPMEKELTTPTSVPETQVNVGESPIELANFEKTDSGAEGKRKRSAWKKVEDELLAKSFVTISDDRIIGNDQKTDAFWGRVASYYNEHRPTGSPNRSVSVIRPHWHNTIHKKVYRFNANYNSVYSAYQNDYSDEKILLLAYEKYRKENNGTAFNLEHVWRIVKDSPMFTSHSADHIVGTKKVRTSESGASNTSSNQDASVGIDLIKEDTRPIGHKASKRKGKDEANSPMESMIEKWDNIVAKFTEYTSMKNVELSMKQKQLEVEVIKAKTEVIKAKTASAKLQLKEYAILSKDTSQMTKEQLIVHEHFCQEIRGRWNM